MRHSPASKKQYQNIYLPGKDIMVCHKSQLRIAKVPLWASGKNEASGTIEWEREISHSGKIFLQELYQIINRKNERDL